MSETTKDEGGGCDRCRSMEFLAETLWALPKVLADTIRIHPYDMAETIHRAVRRWSQEPEHTSKEAGA